jgi:hypothetical protein
MHDKKSPNYIQIIATEIKVLFFRNKAISIVITDANKDIVS